MNNNIEKIKSFTVYCFEHPEQRFWQALRNWNQIENPEHNFILTAELDPEHIEPFINGEDTFYRE